MPILVRHGRALVQPLEPPHSWPLDPSRLNDITALRAVLPELPIVCSDMRRAVETARLLGAPTVDRRLAEIERPWSDELERQIAQYFAGERVDGWEPQADARARFDAVVREYGEAIYVTHGTVLTLYAASVAPALDPLGLWRGLTTPDAWKLDATTAMTRLR